MSTLEQLLRMTGSLWEDPKEILTMFWSIQLLWPVTGYKLGFIRSGQIQTLYLASPVCWRVTCFLYLASPVCWRVTCFLYLGLFGPHQLVRFHHIWQFALQSPAQNSNNIVIELIEILCILSYNYIIIVYREGCVFKGDPNSHSKVVYDIFPFSLLF